MILHGCADDIRHFVEALVVDGLHRMEYSALHGLETVVDMRNGTLENYIGCIFEKPCLVHAAQMMTHYLVGRSIRSPPVGQCSGFGRLGVFIGLRVVYIFVLFGIRQFAGIRSVVGSRFGIFLVLRGLFRYFRNRFLVVVAHCKCFFGNLATNLAIICQICEILF